MHTQQSKQTQSAVGEPNRYEPVPVVRDNSTVQSLPYNWLTNRYNWAFSFSLSLFLSFEGRIQTPPGKRLEAPESRAVPEQRYGNRPRVASDNYWNGLRRFNATVLFQEHEQPSCCDTIRVKSLVTTNGIRLNKCLVYTEKENKNQSSLPLNNIQFIRYLKYFFYGVWMYFEKLRIPLEHSSISASRSAAPYNLLFSFS